MSEWCTGIPVLVHWAAIAMFCMTAVGFAFALQVCTSVCVPVPVPVPAQPNLPMVGLVMHHTALWYSH